MMKRKTHDQFEEIFKEESLRGEKVNWMLHWFLYGIVFLLSCTVYFIQGIRVGKYGVILSLVNLLYNAAISPFIFKRKKIAWNGYVMVTINIVSLSIYNFLDGYFISSLAPATTAAIMLYPIILFLASLRMDKKLIVWATIFSILCMDGIYIFFYTRFDPVIARQIVSSDPLGQFYRTVYLALAGVLMYQVPSTMLRILKTQERLTKESLAHKKISQQDALTGVYNRLFFDQHLKNCIELAGTFNYKVALFFIDLDGFKLLNDTLGHDAGDFILKSVASDLSDTIRDTDIVARIGGDEFVVVMSPFSYENRKKVFDFRLPEIISRTRTFKNKEISISASIGGAVYPDDAKTPEQLIKYADEAMYSVKKSGKNNIKFYRNPST